MSIDPVEEVPGGVSPTVNGASSPVAAAPRVDPVQELADQALSLSRALPGPLKRIAISRGEVTVEVDWQETTEVGGARPAAFPRALAEAVPGRSAADAAALDAAPGTPAAHVVRAPLVGTFYTAPSPEEPAFVLPGDTVAVGQTLGIVEAMKLMNAIVSDVAGRVVEVLLENGSGVEFDQPLVLIEPIGEQSGDAPLAG